MNIITNKRPPPYRYFLAVLAALALVVTSSAALANVDVIHDEGNAYLTVTDEIVPEDEQKFAALVPQAKGVFFNSPGGNLYAAIQIGTAIRLRGLPTVVLDKNFCASACAVAWLGGTPRGKVSTAHVGFHAVYIEKGTDGAKENSGPGNALLGKYLGRLGLSDEAVFYITHAKPDEMEWLTPEKASEVGIEMIVHEPEKKPDVEPSENQNEVVKKFLKTWLDALASNNPYDFIGLFAPSVYWSKPAEAFNKLRSKSEIAGEWVKYIKRWPSRKYTVHENEFSCPNLKTGCRVSVTLDWSFVGPSINLKADGTVKWTVTFQRKHDTFYITNFEEVMLEKHYEKLKPQARLKTEVWYVVDPRVSDRKLNLRKGPGVKYDIVVAIPAGASDVQKVGTCVLVVDSSSRHAWCNVKWHGKVGWVSTIGLLNKKTGDNVEAELEVNE